MPTTQSEKGPPPEGTNILGSGTGLPASASQAASAPAPASAPPAPPPRHNITARSTSLAEYLKTSANTNTNANINDNNYSEPTTMITTTITTMMDEARKGREPILAILEDAGINAFDPNDVLRLPLWSSVSELYYRYERGKNRTAKGSEHGDRSAAQPPAEANADAHANADTDNAVRRRGPVILGLEDCASFRERVPKKDRFLGVAGNFNSGSTAFGIALQANCRLELEEEHNHEPNEQLRADNNNNNNNNRNRNNWSYKRRRGTVVSNVNGMLNQVPWEKHKPANYRHGNVSVLPPSVEPIDHDRVLPVVLSMCREGYGVRWDHDSNHHCPNLVPNDFDRKRFRKKKQNNNKESDQTSSVPVWMGRNPIDGPTWPSLIHYWNEWYESYFYNFNHALETHGEISVGSTPPDRDRVESKPTSNPSSKWPRLIVRFEDTLFYPREVMAEVCHCGGGRLIGEPSTDTDADIETGSGDHSYRPQPQHDYSLEQSKPHHTHEGKSNFVQAMVRYGTNATRLRNMTRDDIRFAVEHLNPLLMQALGYSYPPRSDYE
eukprot:jgi/Psemu1/13819/gm1.13819_g